MIIFDNLSILAQESQPQADVEDGWTTKVRRR